MLSTNTGILKFGDWDVYDNGTDLSFTSPLNLTVRVNTLPCSSFTSKSLTYIVPITEDILNYNVGCPVFASGSIYKLSQSVNGYSFTETTTYTTQNYIPSVKTTGTYQEYVGIIKKIYLIGDLLKYGTILINEMPLLQNAVELITNGNYTVYIGSKVCEVGDEITYDGDVIDDTLPLTNTVKRKSAGVVTHLFTGTDYVSVIKY